MVCVKWCNLFHYKDRSIIFPDLSVLSEFCIALFSFHNYEKDKEMGFSSSVDYSWDDEEMTKILKVNDVKFGDLFKACGRHVVGRPLFFRDTANGPENKYLPATITGFDSTTQRHQLQLHPNQTKLPPPTAATGSPISVDLSKADVRFGSVPGYRCTDSVVDRNASAANSGVAHFARRCCTHRRANSCTYRHCTY